MLNFTFGLTTGIVAGVAGSFVAAIFLIVALEDSPKLLKTLEKNLNN